MIGLDFGTTNSSVAAVDTNGRCVLARFPDGAGETSTFRSVLYFSREGVSPRSKPAAEAGPRAIQAYLDEGGGGRFLQSLKSYLASELFRDTSIFGWKYTLEELIALILDQLRVAARDQLGQTDTRVLLGRPVHFVAGAERRGDPASDARAESRLREAAGLAGFTDIELEYEPVAAAFQYEQGLDRDELVLIGDFGGGTSDFCLVRLGPSFRGRSDRRESILGVDGVPRAGDAFDGRIVRAVVAPRLGLGSLRRSIEGKTLPMPTWIYARLERWEDVSFLATPRTMETLRRLRTEAVEPSRIDSLIHLVEDELGYLLYRAVERSKRALSEAESTKFTFDELPRRILQEIHRGDLDDWLSEELAQLGEAVDRLLLRCNVAVSEVDRVFLTGGSSLVPCVRSLFSNRFGAERLSGGEELTTVARGLALRAAAM